MPTSLATTNVRTRKEWAEIINADWRRSIDSIVQTGRDLIAAKEGPSKLPHGEFQSMVLEDLDFRPRMASELMSIAANPEIANMRGRTHLPSSWTVLLPLSRLSQEDFRDARERGLITPETSQAAARAIAQAYKKDDNTPIGAGGHRRHLPTPSEARDIARETNRVVAASDGNLYTGASNEEVGEYVTRRRAVFGIREAIERIADSGQSPGAWLADTERHWLHDFRLSAIDDAIAWLGGLKDAMEIVDA